MAKTALINKAAGKQKFAVRATPGASGAAARTRCTASSACAGSACARWPTRASSRCDQEQLVNNDVAGPRVPVPPERGGGRRGNHGEEGR